MGRCQFTDSGEGYFSPQFHKLWSRHFAKLVEEKPVLQEWHYGPSGAYFKAYDEERRKFERAYDKYFGRVV